MPPRMSEESFWENFWRKVSKTDTCWLWTGALTTAGYGSLTRNYQRLYAHRVSFEAAHGPLLVGEFACHTCDVRNCVRPEHMFRGSQLDNLQDAAEKDRTLHGRRNPQVKLTAQDVLAIRGIYAGGRVTQHDLAARFGVSQMAISKAVRGETWRRVTPPA